MLLNFANSNLVSGPLCHENTYIACWNLLEETDIDDFLVKIRILREHIQKTIKTPIAERGEPDFKL